jgi:REP element-mobilizing transposase RayT
MSQTFHQIWFHYIWSTKDRENLITPNLKKELLVHIKKYAQQNDFYVDTINGISNHIHLLIKMKPSHEPARVANLLKGESSNWINQNDFLKIKFAWQNGYGVFSVSQSQVDKVRDYILNQENHHKKLTYIEEVDKILKTESLKIQTP